MGKTSSATALTHRHEENLYFPGRAGRADDGTTAGTDGFSPSRRNRA